MSNLEDDDDDEDDSSESDSYEVEMCESFDPKKGHCDCDGYKKFLKTGHTEETIEDGNGNEEEYEDDENENRRRRRRSGNGRRWGKCRS